MHDLTLKYRYKKWGLLNGITFLIILINISAYSQETIFTLKNEADQKIKINNTFKRDTLIHPFKSIKTISGLAISCDLHLNSDTSLVRIIMIDDQYNEFLICESYPLVSTSMHFSLTDYAEETALLNNIHPLGIKFEVTDASIYLKEITTSKEQVKTERAQVDALRQQILEKIRKLNENIAGNKGLWVAGETSVSKMTYNEKKQLFGGKVPNLQGFEYYVGGIFIMPGNTLQSAKSEPKSSYVNDFTWRNRHGQDWLTPVRNQGSCGSCWAFAATGATELLVNLYFNRHIDVHLSEQQLISCSGAGDCSGGSIFSALDFIKSSGIVEESCFSYYGYNYGCYPCVNPSQTVRIGSWSYADNTSYDDIKRSIIKGPVALSIDPWHHAVTLAGYKTIRANDRIYIKSSTQDTWVTVPADDPLVGQTAWLIKNSWGRSFGDNGYAYIVTDIFDFGSIHQVNDPVYSMAYNDQEILCTDIDGDGYYTWGIGSKPAHCPPCPDEPDGDDSDPCLGPMNEFGIIRGITPLPIATDVIISDIDTVPDLTLQGNNVRWYKDEGLDTLVCEGNSFSTGISSLGIYKYFVTQTLSSCESLPATVSLSILPLPPDVNDVTTCSGQEDIIITAVGQNISWYSDNENPLYDSRDGQTYNVVTIGHQIWMNENLNYSTSSGSWYYDNDSLRFARPYGRFYDWNNAQEVCPADWHLPSRNEWLELRDYLGGENVAGGKMKDSGFTYWNPPNTGANNEGGFTALAGGLWGTNGTFGYAEFLGMYAAFASSEDIPEVWWLSYTDSKLKLQYSYYDYGFSVRCLRYRSQAVASGNNLNIDFKDPGTYKFYVTQTINGIESQADTVLLTIIQNSDAPISENQMLCEGEEVPDLKAIGNNILWYTDSELTNLVHSGNIFSSGQTQPGKYKYYATQTTSGCLESPADTVTLDIIKLPTAPIVEDLEFCEGHTDQTLHATGENIVWYSNPQLTNTLGSGNTYKPYQTDRGIYTYFVTQTISGCKSQANTVLFTIKGKPGVPSVTDISICEGEPVPDLTAEGGTIQWYSDAGLTKHVGSGNSFATGQTIPGAYTYYVSQTVSECESNAGHVDLVIYPLPMIDLGKDSIIYPDQSIMLGPFINDNSYLWNDGSQNPYFLISGTNNSLGSHQISVIVIDSNECINTDSVEINVLPYTSVHSPNKSQQINIFPNPAEEFINIDLANIKYEDIIVKIYNQKGEEINVFMISPYNRDDLLKLDVSHLPPGIYYLQILTNMGQYLGKIILF